MIRPEGRWLIWHVLGVSQGGVGTLHSVKKKWTLFISQQLITRLYNL